MVRILTIALILFFFSFLQTQAQDTTSTVQEEEKNPYIEDLGDTEVEDTTTKSQKHDKNNLKSDGEKKTFNPDKGPSKFKTFFERFHFNAATGYGLTKWKSKYYNLDNYDVKYKGIGSNAPIHALILYDFKKFRFGVGGSFEFYFMKKLKPLDYEDVFSTYNLKGIGTFKKFYAHVGIPYFVNKEYTYLANLEIGLFKASKSYSSPAGFRPFVNIGITMERKLSEYFRIYLKPSLEFKSVPFSIEHNNSPTSPNNNRLTSLYVLAGISYSIPMYKKCPIRACGIRVRHYHQGKLFRGNPFYRLQNPNYGEEEKKLIKYKLKNKQILEPY